MYRLLLVLGAVLLFAATFRAGADPAIDYAKASPQQVADAATFEKTKFDVYTKIVGPEWKASFATAGQRPESYYDKSMLSALKNSAGRLTDTYLVIGIAYRAKEWANFDATTLVGGRSAATKSMGQRQISCDADGTCGFAEVIAVVLPNGYLAATANSGFDIRIEPQSGANHVLTVPSSYIKGFLLALDRPLGADGLPASAPAAPAK